MLHLFSTIKPVQAEPTLSILRQTCHVCPPNLESTKPNPVLFVPMTPKSHPKLCSSLMLQPPGHPCIKFFKSPDDAQPVIRKQTRSGWASSYVFETDMPCLFTELRKCQAWFCFFVSITPVQANSNLACPTSHPSMTNVLHYHHIVLPLYYINNVWH